MGQIRHSPSGIPHYRIIVEHRSTQIEAGSKRLALCRIPVHSSGDTLVAQMSGFMLGDSIKIFGFMNTSARSVEGHSNECILHASEVEALESS